MEIEEAIYVAPEFSQALSFPFETTGSVGSTRDMDGGRWSMHKLCVFLWLRTSNKRFFFYIYSGFLCKLGWSYKENLFVYTKLHSPV